MMALKIWRTVPLRAKIIQEPWKMKPFQRPLIRNGQKY